MQLLSKLKKFKNIFFCVFKRLWIFDHYTIFNFLIFKLISLIIIFYVPFILFVWLHYAIFGFYCCFFYLHILRRDQWNVNLTPYPLLTYLSYFLFIFSFILFIEFFFILLFYLWCFISYHSFSLWFMFKNTMLLSLIIAFLFSSFLSFFCLLKMNKINQFLLDWFLVIMLLIISFIVAFFICHRLFDLLNINLFQRRKLSFFLVYALLEYFTYVGALFHSKIYYLIAFLISVIYLIFYFLIAVLNLIKFYNNNKDKNNKDKKKKKNND